MIDIINIIKKFLGWSLIISVKSYGNGLTNKTYLVKTDKGCYVLQKINTEVYKNPKKLVTNIAVAEATLTYVLGDKLKLLKLLETNNKKYYYDRKSKSYWRMYSYIGPSNCFDKAPNLETFYEAGRCFGLFDAALGDLNMKDFYVPEPNLHNTKYHLKELYKVLKKDKYNRKKEIINELNFVDKNKELVGLLDTINLKKQLIHNDTKLNNLLFSESTGSGMAVVDWDYIMPGNIILDFGDAIRSGAHAGDEDDTNLDNVKFSLDLFEKFVDGFSIWTKAILTEDEINNLANAAILITFECGIRFLTDFLRGDIRFTTTREKQNLDRCRVQFKLVNDMLMLKEELNKIVFKYYK